MKKLWFALGVALFCTQPVWAGTLWDQYLIKLKANKLNPDLQGVLLVDQSGEILEGYQIHRPLPAASVTKLATTLAALDRWGGNHRFETKFYGTGPVEAGVLQGDLYVQGSEDPLFTWDDGFSLGQRLEQAGIQKVQGDLVITGPFWMNYSRNSLASARSLRIALNQGLWTKQVSNGFKAKFQGLPAPQVVVQGQARLASFLPEHSDPLLVYPSLPLWKILKRMNAYSTNPLADMLGVSMGGPWTMYQRLIQQHSFSQQGVMLKNASGLGRENRLSPEAVVTLLGALEQRASQEGLNLADIMAVKGPDPGTLAQRKLPLGVMAKTGTLNQVSCLVGIVPTEMRGPLRFVLLNQGPVKTLRQLQDWFVQKIQIQYGKPELSPFVSQGFSNEGRMTQTTVPVPVLLPLEPDQDG